MIYPFENSVPPINFDIVTLKMSAILINVSSDGNDLLGTKLLTVTFEMPTLLASKADVIFLTDIIF